MRKVLCLPRCRCLRSEVPATYSCLLKTCVAVHHNLVCRTSPSPFVPPSSHGEPRRLFELFDGFTSTNSTFHKISVHNHLPRRSEFTRRQPPFSSYQPLHTPPPPPGTSCRAHACSPSCPPPIPRTTRRLRPSRRPRRPPAPSPPRSSRSSSRRSSGARRGWARSGRATRRSCAS